MERQVYSVADKLLRVETALSTTNADSVSAGIDLEIGGAGLPPGDMELLIEAPELTDAQLAATETLTYSVYTADQSNFSDEVLLFEDILQQVGATGGGDGASEVQYRLPSRCARYVRTKVVASENKDKSAAKFAMSLVF